MKYRVIALDLDGTLLTPEKTILPASSQALARARQAGYQVLIVTGRHHVAIKPFYTQLDLTTPVICCNGAYLYDWQGQQVLQASPIDREQALALLDLMAHYQVDGFMYVDDAMLYQTPTDLVVRMRRWGQSLAAPLRPAIRQVPSLREALGQVANVWKFALADADPTRLRAFVARVGEQLTMSCEWSWLDQVDIAREGNNKGQRLAQWAAQAGVEMSEIVAFGDNYNDISMLEAVGLGVAMGNAEAPVQACAKLVTGSNAEGSIARVIEQYLL